MVYFHIIMLVKVDNIWTTGHDQKCVSAKTAVSQMTYYWRNVYSVWIQANFNIGTVKFMTVYHFVYTVFH